MRNYLVDLDLFNLGWFMADVDDHGNILSVYHYDDPTNLNIWDQFDTRLRQLIVMNIRSQNSN